MLAAKYSVGSVRYGMLISRVCVRVESRVDYAYLAGCAQFYNDETIRLAQRLLERWLTPRDMSITLEEDRSLHGLLQTRTRMCAISSGHAHTGNSIKGAGPKTGSRLC